jgi:hypothetical protein
MLHDQVKSLLCLNDIIELNNMRMSYYFKYVYLSCDPFDITHICYFLFLQYFYRNFLISVNVYTLLYFTKSTLT